MASSENETTGFTETEFHDDGAIVNLDIGNRTFLFVLPEPFTEATIETKLAALSVSPVTPPVGHAVVASRITTYRVKGKSGAGEEVSVLIESREPVSMKEWQNLMEKRGEVVLVDSDDLRLVLV